MKIAYITSNQQKFEEAQLILSDWELQRISIELQEIQGDPHEITLAKAKEALSQLNIPLIVEDVSVECDALGGLPGPYVKDFLRKLGSDGLAALVHKYENHHAQVSCIAAYAFPGSEPILFEGVVSGTIVLPRGDLKHGVYSWNPIFQPDGSSKTMGEMTMQEHADVSMRRIALTKLKDYLHHLPKLQT
jgi:inosine triphosphate pyrophosphatase